MNTIKPFEDVPFKPGSPKNGEFNCPNCGAAISGDKCRYCGTVFYDFASIDLDRPQYVKIRFNGKVVACRVRIISCDIHCSLEEIPTINLEMHVLSSNDDGMFTVIDERKTL